MSKFISLKIEFKAVQIDSSENDDLEHLELDLTIN